MTTVSRDVLKEMVRDAVRQALADSPSLPSSDDAPKPAPTEYFAPWTGAVYEAHPSQQKFSVGEAASLASNLLEFAAAQSCTIEMGKACDQCGMCRSLGF